MKNKDNTKSTLEDYLVDYLFGCLRSVAPIKLSDQDAANILSNVVGNLMLRRLKK